MLLNVERKNVGRMRNKEVEQCVFNLTSGIKCKDIPENLKKISNYIDKLERENLGLKTQVAHFREKEEKRYREAGWRQ